MLRPSFSLTKSYEYNIGVLLTIGSKNTYEWQVNTLTIYLLFFEVSLGLHFKRWR